MQHRMRLAARIRDAMILHCALGRGDQGGKIDAINRCCDPSRVDAFIDCFHISLFLSN